MDAEGPVTRLLQSSSYKKSSCIGIWHSLQSETFRWGQADASSVHWSLKAARTGRTIMLYQAIDAHLASLTPARLTARWMHQMMSHPMLPYSYTLAFAPPPPGFELFDRATPTPAEAGLRPRCHADR